MDDVQPWTKLMPDSYWNIPDDFDHGLDVFRSALARSPASPAIKYFDKILTYDELDRLSDRLAQDLIEKDFKPGDRLAAYTQNIPEFPISLLATWKAGGVFVPVNPMNRERELAIILEDAAPTALLTEAVLYNDVVARLPGSVWKAKLCYIASTQPPSISEPVVVPSTDGYACSLEVALAREPAPLSVEPGLPGDPAFLVYTSGTTGVPKAAVISHAAVGRGSAYAARAYGLDQGDTIISLAPVFHMTGLMSTMMTAFYLGGQLILTYRFETNTILSAIRDNRPAFTAAAPTAYIALMEASDDPHLFQCFKSIAIGGAPVPPAIVERLRERFGIAAQTGYGMTETGGAVIITPTDLRDSTPVDSVTGALAIGIPLPGVHVWIAGDDGAELRPREVGEIIIGAPTNMSAYWNKPEDSEVVLNADGLRTGDVGFMDEQGWFYLVDRKKDMIVAAGFKVWPREVEDVLYMHHQVLEAAVVGVPDPYRGETIKAYVVAKTTAIEAVDLVAHCKKYLAAYKIPKEVEFVSSLEKTVSGKIKRAAMRATGDAEGFHV